MDVTLFGIDVAIDETVLDWNAEIVRERVAEYERGDRTAFDAAVDYPEGLTGEVVRAMQQIPYGRTRTYGEVASDLGTAPVAVGQACGRNPVPIVVPCHRVVGADSLGGFSAGGDRGRELKRRLLQLESGEATTTDATVQARLG